MNLSKSSGIIFILTIYSITYAAKYDIKGTVIGADGKVKVKLAGTNKDARTKKDGAFKLNNVPEGEYTLQIIQDKKVIHEQYINVTRDDGKLKVKIGSSTNSIKSNLVRKNSSSILSKDPLERFLDISKLYQIQKNQPKIVPTRRVIYSSSDFRITSKVNYENGLLLAVFEIENFTDNNYKSVYFMINGEYEDSYILNENDFDAPKSSFYGVIDRTISDKNGKFKFKWISMGKNKIIAYKPATKFYAEFPINIKSPNKLKLDIELREHKYDQYEQDKIVEWNKYKLYYVTKYFKEKKTLFNNPLSKSYYLSLFNYEEKEEDENSFKKRIRFEDLNKLSKSKVEIELDNEIFKLSSKFLKSTKKK